MINTRERQLRQYKNKFSIKFAEIMSKQRYEWKEIQKKHRLSLVSFDAILWYFGFALPAYLPGKHEHNYDLKMHFYISIGAFIYAVFQNIHYHNKKYQTQIKKTAFPQLVKIFGENINYFNPQSDGYSVMSYCNDLLGSKDISSFINAGIKGCIPNEVFEASQLYADCTVDRRNDDDIFYGNYNSVDFVINETELGSIDDDDKRHGKNTCVRFFKGVAMHFKMNKVVKNRVLIMSKSYLLNSVPKGYEKVDVEYNKFSAKYNVYVQSGRSAEGQIEARYLLNAAFLDRFMQLHTSFAIPRLQCSVYGENMLIMLTTNKDLFEMNHLFGKIDDISQYNRLFDEFASVLSFIDVLNLSSKTKL